MKKRSIGLSKTLHTRAKQNILLEFLLKYVKKPKVTNQKYGHLLKSYICLHF